MSEAIFLIVYNIMIFKRVQISSITIVMNATRVVHTIIIVLGFSAQNGIITPLARSRFEFGMFIRSEFYYPSGVPMPRTIYGIIVQSTIRLCKEVMRCRQ